MLRSAITLAFLFSGAVGTAAAQSCSCSVGNLNEAQLSSTFSGRQVCAVVNAEIQQELHQGAVGTATGGNVKAYKRGPLSTMDPSEVVGTWSITGTGTSAKLQYNYSGGATFAYSVCQLNTAFSNTYCYVNGGQSYTVTRLTDLLGTGNPVQCPGAPGAAAAALRRPAR